MVKTTPPLCPVCWQAGRFTLRQVATLESHFDHHAKAVIPALCETANPVSYVTQLPEASTHPKYMSRKDETRGGADSIRAVTTRKVGPFYTGDGKGSRQKTERSPATRRPGGCPRGLSHPAIQGGLRNPDLPSDRLISRYDRVERATAPGQIET